MLSRVSLGRGNSPPARTSSTHIIQGVLGIRFAPLLLYLQHAGFSTIFARFLPFFVHTGPLAQRRERNREQEHRNRGPGARAGRQRRPKAACGRRRTARAPRPGAPPPRAPGGAAPTGGTRPRRRATAGRPARQERAEGERVHRGGYRHARAEGPTTPNPRSARGAARGAARRR